MTDTEQRPNDGEHQGDGAGCPKTCACGAPCERERKGHRNHYCAGCAPAPPRPRAEVRAEESAEVGCHPVDGGRFTYSAQGDPGHSSCCRVPHGLYADGVHVLDLPRTVARIIQGGTGAEMTGYLVSARRDTANVLLPYKDVAEGRWAPRLGMRPSGDRQVMAATASAIFHAAHCAGVPEHRQALRPSDVTPTGHIPTPLEGTLPPGYMSADPYREGETDAQYAARTRRAHLTIASIAANNNGNGKLALILGLSAAAPYLGAVTRRAAGEAGVVELAGAPRSGKSSMLTAAASLWGPANLPPDPGVIIAWDGTQKGVLRTLGQLGIFSPFIDETGTSDMDQGQWFKFVMSAAQGASRVTATQDGMGSARSAGWVGLIFASGNREIITETPIGRYAGVPARVTTIGGPFTRSAAESDRLVAAASQGYGLLGPRVLETVTVGKMREWAEWAGVVIGTPDGDTGRSVALRLALGVAGAMALDHVLGTNGRLRDAALAAAIEHIRGVADPTTDRELALERLAEDIAARPGAWPSAAAWAEQLQPRESIGGGYSPPEVTPRIGVDREIGGVIDGEHVYVFPQWWRAMVAESGLSARDALADLYQRGELSVSDAQRAKGEWTTRTPRWRSQPRPWAYRISRAAIDGAGEDADRGGDDGQGDSIAAGADTTPPPPADPPADAVRWSAPELAAPSPPPEVPRRREQPAVRSPKGGRFGGYTPEQETARDIALRVLADPELAQIDPSDGKTVGKWAGRLGLMVALEGNHRRDAPDVPAAFGPRAQGRGAYLQPWGRGRNRTVPEQVDSAYVIRAYSWERPHSGPLARFDRNMAYLAACASADFALDKLIGGGECDLAAGPLAPGYYLVEVFPWTETGLPSPLDRAEVGTSVWVAAPTARLLGELHAAGRWPSAVASATFTSERKGRLRDWAGFCRDVRREAADTYGAGSIQETVAKRGYAMVFGQLAGSRGDRGLEWRNCYTTRKDWSDTIIAQSAASVWRDADNCLSVAPDAGPVKLAATDALVLPAVAVEAVTTVIPAGRTHPPLRIDETGAALGTYKTQETSESGKEDGR